jgi:hypothetical protein
LSLNLAESGGGIYGEDTSQLTINNSILWGNRATISNNEMYQINNATAEVNYSIVQGGYIGTNNLDADPLFVAPSTSNFNIQGNSTAFNKGNNLAFPPEIKIDVAGNPRITNGIIDIGAYEFTLEPAQYGASNPDLIAAFGYNLEAFRQHYFNNGRFEGRSTDSFDELRYTASNSDLITAFGLNGAAATQHYITNGYREGRSKTAFDPARYLLSQPDLLTAFGTNLSAATQHYISSGFAPEGRDPNVFLSDRYIASHGDLIQAFRYNLEAGSNHYLFNGQNEGRGISFSPEAYLTRNADVNNAFGGDLVATTKHYINFGFNENRPIA